MPELQLVWEFSAPKDSTECDVSLAIKHITISNRKTYGLSQTHQSVEGSTGELYGFFISGTEDVFVQL